MITIQIDFQVLLIISLKALTKYINMQPDWPLRLLRIKSYYFLKARTNYGKFNIRSSGAKLGNAIKQDLKSVSRFRRKKLLKESVISKH